jgi:hypothetical protein
MKKNVSGQKIGAQMIDAATGAAFTSSVTVYVTGDAGTQAAGSVSSGACTHEGNGYHTYAPREAAARACSWFLMPSRHQGPTTNCA